MTTNRKVKRITWTILFGVLVLLLLGIVHWATAPWIIGLNDPPDWTGFNVYENDKGQLVVAKGSLIKAKTLWDWLDLLIDGLIVGGVLAIGAYFLNRSARKSEQKIAAVNRLEDRRIAEENRKTDRYIAQDRQHQKTLENYLDRMSALLLDNKLRESKEGDEVRSIACTRTLATLRSLGRKRKGSLLKFLYESNLIGKENAIVDLMGADLRGANLGVVDLSEVDLSSADLSGANLNEAKLCEANLIEANLIEANLNEANLHKANLR